MLTYVYGLPSYSLQNIVPLADILNHGITFYTHQDYFLANIYKRVSSYIRINETIFVGDKH